MRTRIMHSSTICVIILHFVGEICQTYQCKPQASITNPEIGISSTTTLRCDISFDSNCLGDIEVMVYRKKQLGIDTWKEVFRLYSDNTGIPDLTDPKYNLTSRAKASIFLGQFDLTIESPRVPDSGLWQCVYVHKNSAITESEAVELTVTAPCSVHVKGPDEFVFGRELEFECTCPHVYPQITPTWEHGGKSYEGLPDDERDGYVYNIRNTINLISTSYNDTQATCVVAKTSGTETWVRNGTSDEPTDIKTPSIIEQGLEVLFEVNTSATLNMNCVASGTNVEIEWIRGNEILKLPNKLFDNVTSLMQGNFSYGQTTAVKSTLTWKPPPSSSCAMCYEKERHQGKYECIAKGLFNGDSNSETEVKLLHINGCISVGGLVGIVLGTLVGVAVIGLSIYFCVCKKSYAIFGKEGSEKPEQNDEMEEKVTTK